MTQSNDVRERERVKIGRVKPFKKGDRVRIAYANPSRFDVFAGCEAIVVSMDRRPDTQKAGGYFRIRFCERQFHPVNMEPVLEWDIHGVDLEAD